VPGHRIAPSTRADWTDRQLRAEIWAGRLKPGDRIPVERLADDWGVSPTPIRESLRRLAGEGLVDLAPQRGARVAVVDPAQAAELYAVRLLLEPVALRDSVTLGRGDASFQTLVKNSFTAMVDTDDPVEQHEAHRAFHLALMSRCTNRTLLAQIEALMDRARLYQAVGKPDGRRSPHRSDHLELMKSAAAGDVETTIAVHTAHLAATLRAVQELIDTQGGTCSV
jgi:GntR family transcriptional regulator, carbon starvation induced regulator